MLIPGRSLQIVLKLRKFKGLSSIPKNIQNIQTNLIPCDLCYVTYEFLVTSTIQFIEFM